VKKGRKIIAYIATSAYGYIARSDGNVDWLNRPRPADEYGMGLHYGVSPQLEQQLTERT